jgi:hypothetical protein
METEASTVTAKAVQKRVKILVDLDFFVEDIAQSYIPNDPAYTRSLGEVFMLQSSYSVDRPTSFYITQSSTFDNHGSCYEVRIKEETDDFFEFLHSRPNVDVLFYSKRVSDEQTAQILNFSGINSILSPFNIGVPRIFCASVHNVLNEEACKAVSKIEEAVKRIAKMKDTSEIVYICQGTKEECVPEKKRGYVVLSSDSFESVKTELQARLGRTGVPNPSCSGQQR